MRRVPVGKWNNNPALLYHGTTLFDLRAYDVKIGTVLTDFSIELSRCREFTDFGRGFYLTSSENQAINWANVGVDKYKYRKKSKSNTKAVLLVYEVNRENLAKLDYLAFGAETIEFKQFVRHCRTNGAKHNRSTSGGVFDVVYGPLTRYPSDGIFSEADQISFHSEQSLDVLGKPKVWQIGGPSSGYIQTDYRE